MTIHAANVQHFAMHLTHPVVILVEGEGSWITDLNSIIVTDALFGIDVASRVTVGLPYIGHPTDESAGYAIISLLHRDAPLNIPVRQILDLTYEAFLAEHDLPTCSADELHLSMIGQPVADLGVINWLAAFVEAYEALED